jgi:DnaK suppressor protein
MGRILMASALKNDELESYRQTLASLRGRLRGDLEQLTDEALHRNGAESGGNLSNMPIHMADVGTENYDQEFDLGLIENQQVTLDLVYDALARVEAGTFGICVECNQPIAKPRLQAIPYTPYCIECARKMETS